MIISNNNNNPKFQIIIYKFLLMRWIQSFIIKLQRSQKPQQNPKQYYSNNAPTTLTLNPATANNNVVREIKAVVDTDYSSISFEQKLNTIVKKNTIEYFTVNSVLKDIKNEHENDVGRAFRFFLWAMKHRGLRSTASRSIIIDMIITLQYNDNVFGFERVWKTLDLMKSLGVEIVSEAFMVLMLAYEKVGNVEKAIETFGRMSDDYGVEPNMECYNLVLRFLFDERGQEYCVVALGVFHKMKCELELKCKTYGIMINGLCKAGLLNEAMNVFDEMDARGESPNLMIYTMVISGLCRGGRIYEAFELFEKMKSNGVEADTVVYNVLLDGFCKMDRLGEAIEVSKRFKEEGYVCDLYGYSCLIDRLLRVRRFEDARDCYHEMVHEKNILPDLILYTIMIKGCMNMGKVDDADVLLEEMKQKGIVPDTYWYNTLMKVFFDVGQLDKAQSLFKEISKPDSATYPILIHGLCKGGLIDEAHQIFEDLVKEGKNPDGLTCNTLIHGLCEANEMDKAIKVFCWMEIGRNPSMLLRLSRSAGPSHSGNSLQNKVDELCESGSILEAYKLIKQVIDIGFAPDIITYNTLIYGYCKKKDFTEAYRILEDLKTMGCCNADSYATLIHGLLNQGRDKEALSLFNKMALNGVTPTVIVYRTLIISFCQKKNVSFAFDVWFQYVKSLWDREEGAFKLVEENFLQGNMEMVVRGLLQIDIKCEKLNPLPYTLWLDGLCKAERFKEAGKIFSILEEFRIDVTMSMSTPMPKCVLRIDSLCREGELDLALCIFKYTLKKGFLLDPRLCQRLIWALFSQDKAKHLIDLEEGMRSAGYDLDKHLLKPTKAILSGCRRKLQFKAISSN